MFKVILDVILGGFSQILLLLYVQYNARTANGLPFDQISDKLCHVWLIVNKLAEKKLTDVALYANWKERMINLAQ